MSQITKRMRKKVLFTISYKPKFENEIVSEWVRKVVESLERWSHLKDLGPVS